VISGLARRRRSLTPTNVVVIAIALGFAGFYAGVREEKTQAPGSASTRSVSRTTAARSGSVRPSTGVGTASASAGGITAGAVIRVDGNTVYIKEASGATVQAKLLSSTAIKKTQDVSSHSVRPGDSVTIQGTQGSGGTITSTSVSDSGDNSTATTSSGQAAAATNSG
jgi:hypothetical protein